MTPLFPLKERCLSPSASSRTVLIVDGHEALMRARRRRHRWDAAAREYYTRHKWQVEGVHGEGKTQHGLRRAVRRGTDNVSIQAYLTAAVINLKRLAVHLLPSGSRIHALYVFLWRRIKNDIHFLTNPSALLKRRVPGGIRVGILLYG